jgi:hypothetical protein
MLDLCNIPIIDNLYTTFDTSSSHKLLIYHINYNETCPFIQILLSYNIDKKLIFPELETQNLNSALDKCEEIIETFLIKKCNNREIYFRGIHKFKNSSYCIIDISNIKLFNLFSSTDDIYNFVCLTDIIYNKSLFGRHIDENITDYFKNNLENYLLKDNNNNNIQLPYIGYLLKKINEAKFTNIFGIIDYSNSEIMLYSSFLDVIKSYQNSQSGCWAINRLVLFDKVNIDNHTILENEIKLKNGNLLLKLKNNAHPLSCFLC